MTEERRIKQREYTKRYEQRHPEKCKESHRKYYLAHREELLEKAKIRARGTESATNRYRRRRNARSVEECNKDLYRKNWTLKEEQFLCDNYDKMTRYELSEVMGRTITAIERKRNKLGILKEHKNEQG